MGHSRYIVTNSARPRASDRVSLITAASPTERTIQSRLSGTKPETSHGCVLNAHHGLVNIPPARDRVNRRIVDIPNYSRRQTTERPYLSEVCLDTNRLSGSFRSGITERCIIARPCWTRFFYRLSKSPLPFRNAIRQFNGEKMTRRTGYI